MTFLSLLPVILSFLVLAAHFLHADNLVFVAVSLLMPFLLLVRRRWVVWTIQFVLLLGAVEWLWTMVELIGIYQDEGRPWKRMVIILGCVMLFTVASGLVFMIPPVRRRFCRIEPRGFEPVIPSPCGGADEQGPVTQ